VFNLPTAFTTASENNRGNDANKNNDSDNININSDGRIAHGNPDAGPGHDELPL